MHGMPSANSWIAVAATICRSFTAEASGISAEKRSLRPNTWSWSSTIETWRSPKARCDSKPWLASSNAPK